MGFFAGAERNNQVTGFLVMLIYFLLTLQIFFIKFLFKKNPKQPNDINCA